MNNRIKLLLLSAIAALGLSNCVDLHQNVKVKKDGSGTIEETILIRVPAELEKLGNGKQDPIADLNKEDVQKRRAKELGKEVELVSSKRFETKDGAKGLKTVFKFKDVTKLKLTPEAGISDEINLRVTGTPPKEKKDDEIIKFGLEKGDTTAKLSIEMPEMGEGEANYDQKQFDVFKIYAKGMRVRITVKPDGKITKTDASHPDSKSDSVTLVDFEMDKIAKDQATMKSFFEVGKVKDRKQVAETFKKIGVKGETKEKITVEFK